MQIITAVYDGHRESLKVPIVSLSLHLEHLEDFSFTDYFYIFRVYSDPLHVHDITKQLKAHPALPTIDKRRKNSIV